MKISPDRQIIALLIAGILSACTGASSSESKSCHKMGYPPASVAADIFYNYAIQQNMQIKIIAPDGREAWMGNKRWMDDESAALPIGFRKKAADGSLSWGWMQTLYHSSILQGKNLYRFILLDANAKQELESKSITVTHTKDECGFPNVELSEPIEFTLTSAPSDPIDSSKEYLPLEDGSVIALDANTGIANVVGGSKTWTDIEIVRVIDVKTTFQNSGGVTNSTESLEERAVVDKTRVGRLIEFGIDRGPLPQDPQNFPNYQWKNSEIKQLEVTDTKSRIIYGKPTL